MRVFPIALAALLLAGCAAEPGSEQWCQQKMDQPKTEWTAADAATFAKSCVFESTTIGSKKWCEGLADRPKGEWTADEAASYAKHCVL